MPDGLYDRDILVWSEQQANLLGRLAAGERVNDEVDWPNVIEELEAVGRSELKSCESLLFQAMLHLMKLRLEPDSLAASHWRGEVIRFADQARRSFSPSMRQRIDLPDVYAGALRVVRAGPKGRIEIPASCPYELDEFLAIDPDLASLLARLG